MTRPRTFAALVLVGVFVVGGICGAATATAVISRRLSALFEGPPRETLGRIYAAVLDRRVHLSAEQRRQIEQIVDEDQPRIAEQLRRVEPDLAALRQERHRRILAVLTPEQRAVAEELERQFQRRHREELGLPTL